VSPLVRCRTTCLDRCVRILQTIVSYSAHRLAFVDSCGLPTWRHRTTSKRATCLHQTPQLAAAPHHPPFRTQLRIWRWTMRAMSRPSLKGAKRLRVCHCHVHVHACVPSCAPLFTTSHRRLGLVEAPPPLLTLEVRVTLLTVPAAPYLPFS